VTICRRPTGFEWFLPHCLRSRHLMTLAALGRFDVGKVTPRVTQSKSRPTTDAVSLQSRRLGIGRKVPFREQKIISQQTGNFAVLFVVKAV